MRRMLVLIIGIVMFSKMIFAIDYTYSPAILGDHSWHTSSNWTPNGIPGSADNVSISDSVVISSNVTVNKLTLSNLGVINTNAVLTVNDTVTWTGGTLRGTGTTVFAATAIVNISGDSNKNLYSLNVDNFGYITWSGSGEIKVNNDARITNKVSATIEIQNNTRLDYVQVNHGGYLTNQGTITKTASTGGSFQETQIDPIFVNSGTVNVNTGTMQIERGDSTIASNGTFTVASGAFLNFVDRPFMCDGATFTGNGTIHIKKANTRPTFISTGSGATFSAGLTLDLDTPRTPTDGQIKGDGPITINGNFVWEQGAIYGTGSFIVNGTTTISGTTDKLLNGRTITLNGTTNWSSTAKIFFDNNCKLINSSGATFQQTTATLWDTTSGSSAGTFQNDGTYIYSNSGSLSMNVTVQNNGTFNFQSGGTIIFRKPVTNSTTGIFSGIGSLDIRKPFTQNGTINPGNSAGTLTIVHTLTQTSTSIVNIEIGGLTQGSEYDRLSILSSATLDGTLNASLINNFAPLEGQTFEIIGFASRTGTFSTFNSPMVNGNPLFSITYTSTSVILTANFDAPLPVELSSFTAIGGFRRVDLEWITASEINNLGFEIYRSTNEEGPYNLIASFATDPSLKGAGTSNLNHHYAYRDRELGDGVQYWYQLADVDYNGIRKFHQRISAYTSDHNSSIRGYVLHQNYPNPFNPETNIAFSLPQESKIRITIFDLLGQKVRILDDTVYPAGEHQVRWDGRNEEDKKVSTGVYLLQMEVFDIQNGYRIFVDVKRMMLTH